MTTVIYHSADYDGIFCREIARKFIPEAQFSGWNFGDLKIPVPLSGTIYILDLPPDCLDFPYDKAPHGNLLPSIVDRIVWIDHHKTSINEWPSGIPGYRIDGVAACRLAWQWFLACLDTTPSLPRNFELPFKQDFIDRKVSEPLAVRLVGEYDVWDHRGDGDLEFQYGLKTEEPSINWGALFEDQPYVYTLINQGRVAMRYSRNMDSDLVKHKSYRIKWEGLNFLVLNTGSFNSLTFAAVDVPETGHDALLGYMFNGKLWTVSLYHAKHRTDLDLSEIAKKYGGGGHRGACGFTCKALPWMAHEACEKGDAA